MARSRSKAVASTKSTRYREGWPKVTPEIKEALKARGWHPESREGKSFINGWYLNPASGKS